MVGMQVCKRVRMQVGKQVCKLEGMQVRMLVCKLVGMLVDKGRTDPHLRLCLVQSTLVELQRLMLGYRSNHVNIPSREQL